MGLDSLNLEGERRRKMEEERWVERKRVFSTLVGQSERERKRGIREKVGMGLTSGISLSLSFLRLGVSKSGNKMKVKSLCKYHF